MDSDKDICPLFDMICTVKDNSTCAICSLYQDYCLEEERCWFRDRFGLTEEEFNSIDKIIRDKISTNINNNEEKFW